MKLSFWLRENGVQVEFAHEYGDWTLLDVNSDNVIRSGFVSEEEAILAACEYVKSFRLSISKRNEH